MKGSYGVPRNPRTKALRNVSTNGPQLDDKKLLQWLKSEPQFGTERFAYIGQLVFMNELDDPESTLEFMKRLRDKFCSTLAFFKKMENEESQQGEQEMSGDEFYGYLGLRMGIRSLAARIQWCDEAIEKINERYSK